MFQTRLKELREAAGYRSQQALADALGTSQSTVANWESGRRNPKHTTAIYLAEFFGVSVDCLLGLEIKERPTPVSGSGPLYPPEYDLLNPEDKELVDSMIRSLAKKKSDG